MNEIIPKARMPLEIRPATVDDLGFIDALQKKHTRQVGFMHRKALEAKIAAGHVIVAEVERDETKETRVGFVMGCDRYFKRDDCGIIYQLCIEPGQRRSLVGAMLVKAMFDRAAYGCRLFCCWCAQDIEANHFWESLGFVPLAFRAGSAKKGRVHIFWQRRIRADDTTTPWWFPSQTTGGSIRQDRLVLPIPPGTHWSDPMPVILPETPVDRPPARALPDAEKKRPARKAAAPKPADPYANALRGFVFASQLPPPQPAPAPKPKRPRRERMKHDPRHIALARELRDRWLEEVARDPSLLLPAGKYDPARRLPEPAPRAAGLIEARILPEAA